MTDHRKKVIISTPKDDFTEDHLLESIYMTASSSAMGLSALILLSAPLMDALVVTSGAPASTLVAGPALSPACAAVTAARTPLRASVVMKRDAADKDMLELDGIVLESLRGASFRVQLQDSDQVPARMRLASAIAA